MQEVGWAQGGENTLDLFAELCSGYSVNLEVDDGSLATAEGGK